jgi:hypothetical protein
MDRTIQGNWACNQQAFSAFRTQHTGNTSTPFERAGNTGLVAFH